jgi:MFS family permease
MTESKGAMAPKSLTKRIMMIVFAMVQITLGAGLIVGWPGIAGSMLVEGLSTGGAGLTLDETTQLYSLAAAVNYVAPLFLGLVLDHFGPRACSFLSNTIVSAGLAVFAMGSTFATYAIGICLVAFGGPSVQQSLLHIGNMFGERRYFVMGMVAESITLSFAVFPVLDIVWDDITREYGFRVLFFALSVIVAFSSIGSLLIWPDAPYEIFGQEEKSGTEATETQALSPPDEAKVATPSTFDLKTASFKEQVTSNIYFRLLFFFMVTSWLANFYIATVTIEVRGS